MNPALRSLLLSTTCLLLLAGSAGLSGCGMKAPAKPVDYSKSNEVSLALGKVNREYGLRQVKFEKGDGATIPATIEGSSCQAGIPGAWKEGYIYFAIAPSFKASHCREVKVSVNYFDAAPGFFELQFDGSDRAAPGEGAYTRCPKKVTLNGARSWETAGFQLTDTCFENSQNGNADFRLHFQASEFYVSWVAVSRE